MADESDDNKSTRLMAQIQVNSLAALTRPDAAPLQGEGEGEAQAPAHDHDYDELSMVVSAAEPSHPPSPEVPEAAPVKRRYRGALAAAVLSIAVAASTTIGATVVWHRYAARRAVAPPQLPPAPPATAAVAPPVEEPKPPEPLAGEATPAEATTNVERPQLPVIRPSRHHHHNSRRSQPR
jgi:hypothetical protein